MSIEYQSSSLAHTRSACTVPVAALAAVRALFGSIASVHACGGVVSWQYGVAVRGASASSGMLRCAQVSSSLHARHSAARPTEAAYCAHSP